MKKNSKKSKKSREETLKIVEDRLARWNRMMSGDTQALIEIMVERRMATEEDFPEFFPKRNVENDFDPVHMERNNQSFRHPMREREPLEKA